MQSFIIGKPAYYWERDNDRITQALMTMNQMLDEKRKEKERRMARDLAMLQNDPRAAAGPAGRQFMETYADDPQAVSFVQSLASQGESQMNLEAGQSSYFEGLFKEHQAQGRRAAEFYGIGKDLQDSADLENDMAALLGQEPDPRFSPQGMMASELEAQMDFSRNQPSPEWNALLGVPDAQRGLVARDLYAKGKFPTPKILGVGMDAVDPKLLMAQQMGLPPEDLYNMFRYQSGLTASPGAVLQDSTTRAGWTHQDELLKEEERLRRERIGLQEASDIRVKTTPPGKNPDSEKAEKQAKGSAGVEAVWKDMKEQDKAAKDVKKSAPATAPPATVVQRAKVDADKFGWDAGTAAEIFSAVWQASLQEASGDPKMAAGIFSTKWAKGVASSTPK